MTTYHLAQINIAKAVDDMQSPAMHGFTSRLDEINALAEQSPGFIWRLQTEEGDATSIQVMDDPLVIVNMSVWQDVESLKHFVYKTIHVELIQDREAWFSKMADAHQALWWVPEGYQPSAEEGVERLQRLRLEGPSPRAFTMAKTMPKPA